MYKEENPEYRKMTEGTPRMLRIATVKSRWERPVSQGWKVGPSVCMS